MREKTATWADIKTLVNSMDEEQLMETATVCMTDIFEFYPILKSHGEATECEVDVLDEGHTYLRV